VESHLVVSFSLISAGVRRFGLPHHDLSLIHISEPSPMDVAMLSGLVRRFTDVMAEGASRQKKDLLHCLVKKVLVHSR